MRKLYQNSVSALRDEHKTERTYVRALDKLCNSIFIQSFHIAL